MTEAGGMSWSSRRADALAAGLLAVGTLVLLVATLNDYGMAWDEGFTVEREERLQEWFARVAGDSSPQNRAWEPTYSKLERRSDYYHRAGASAESPWSRESLRYYWQFAREEPNGHPPFYALLGLAGWSVTRNLLPPPASYRFGPAALFAATVGVVYLVMAPRYGRAAALAAALGLVAMPRMFAHAHLASYDVPTLCLWFLAVAAFLKIVDPPPEATGLATEPCRRDGTWVWTIALGLAWGCALATKLTGWFVPIPLVAWTVVYRNRRGACALLIGGVVAALVVYALIPTWWADPIRGVREFLTSNLTRDQRMRPIPTVFFGRLYRFSLPWYNTLVLTAIVVPPLTLLLGLLGAARVVAGRFRDRAGTLFLICWAFFLVLRALPNAPGHDGERQFLAAFVFLACLAGVGLAGLGRQIERLAAPRAARAITAAVLATAIGAGGWSTWRFHPLQLSYFNGFIGSLSGASRLGMEPTYYWDAVTPDVREWLNSHTAEGRAVDFCFHAISFEYLHHWGLLRPLPFSGRRHPPQWYVVMNRPGHLLFPRPSVAQFLLEHARPAFVKNVPSAPDVPLVLIYTGEDAYAAGLILKRPDGAPPAPKKQ